jgi:hypothetical protein
VTLLANPDKAQILGQKPHALKDCGRIIPTPLGGDRGAIVA